MGLDGWISGWVSFRVKGEDLGIICQIRDEANEIGKFKIPIIGEAGGGRRGAAGNRISAARPLQSRATAMQCIHNTYMQQSVKSPVQYILAKCSPATAISLQPTLGPRSSAKCTAMQTQHTPGPSPVQYICSKV